MRCGSALDDPPRAYPARVSTTESRPNPFLQGNLAPVDVETTAFDLEVTGVLPRELNGRYLRNGPNPLGSVNEAKYHWFSGHGMVHGIRIRDGRAEWYRNRWVRTRALEGVDRMASGTFDLTVGLANTHVVRHAGRIFALEEGSYPNEVTPELDTIGPCDFDGRLRTPFTAHPHMCPETGEMHFFGYELVSAPFITYHEIGRAHV